MCWVLYIAADEPLPLIAWDEKSPAFNVTTLRDVDEPVRARFTRPHVAYLGAHTGCGCGFDPGQANQEHPDEARDTAAALAALADYLRTATADGRAVELYVCWSGDEALPVEQAMDITPDALHPGMEWFPERTLLSVRTADA